MKKFIALSSALIIAFSGLTACGKKKDKAESKEVSATVSDGSGVSEKQNDGESLILNDSVYREYLEQQKLCTVSKEFKINYDGGLRDNPYGLAAAVKYDFNKDKTDDLVTFTFERNPDNGEDIRIDYIQNNIGILKVVDSVYMTEIMDMSYYREKKNTIYSWAGTIEIVTSECNGDMYLGMMLSKVYDDINRGGDSRFLYSAFNIENGKITALANGTTEKYAVGITRIYSSLLPPAIRDTTDTNGFIEEVEEGKKEIILCDIDTNRPDESKGLYSSDTTAISDLMNDFGLDAEPKKSEDVPNPDFNFVSKNHSEIKRILYTQYLENTGYGADEHNMYSGIRLELDSDLEEILGVEDPFNNYTSENDYYKEVLTYRYYFPEIWKYFSEGRTELICNYCILDINDDKKNELVIVDENYKKLSVIDSDKNVMTTGNFANDLGLGCINIINNGIIRISGIGRVHYSITETPNLYLDTKIGEIFYSIKDEKDDGYDYTIMKSNADESLSLSGEEKKKKINELENGIFMNPELNNVNDVKLNDILVIDDAEKLKLVDYKEAYKKYIDKCLADEDDNTMHISGYSYTYLNNDDIPDIIVKSTFATESEYKILVFENNKVECVERWNARSYCKGPIEKEGIFESGGSGGSEYNTKEIIQYNNGYRDILCYYEENFGKYKYIVNGKNVTEAEYNAEYDKYSKRISEGKPLDTECNYSYDEIMRILSGEKIDKHPTIEPTTENTSPDKADTASGSETAKVKAGGGLNMRETPGIDGKKIMLIPDGSTVEVNKKDGEWSYVTYDGKSGWVKNSFLK